MTRLLQPAQDPAGTQAASAVFSFHQQVPSPTALADPAATAPMARTFSVAVPVTLRPRASALALPGPGLDALLGRVSPPGPGLLQVTVAGSPAAEPPGFPASLISGSGSVPWTAASASPVIHLSWHGQRRIDSLIVRPARGLPSTPQTVTITSPDGTRQASIGAGGLVRFPVPLTTDRIDVSFPRVRQATVVSDTGQLATLPVRLSQLSVPALAGLRAVTPDQQARFSLACGQGPALTVDGQAYRTAVSGTVGELSGYLPLPVLVCSPDGTLSLGAGRHTLTAAAPGTFAVTDLSLASVAPGAQAATASSAGRAVTVHSWQPDQRQVSIGPGAASYLEMHGNVNSGWSATLNGQQLTPVRLDGWQQGFVVPAGPGGTVTLSFRAAATYHLVLAVSLAAAAILLAIAAWSFTRRRRRGDGAGVRSGLWSGLRSGLWSGGAGSLGAVIGRGRQRSPARLAGRARCHRADLRGGRPGGAGRPGTRLPDLAAVACIRAARPGDVAALGRVRRHGRVGTAVRGTTVRQQPVRFVRRVGAGVRPRRAGRRVHAGG